MSDTHPPPAPTVDTRGVLRWTVSALAIGGRALHRLAEHDCNVLRWTVSALAIGGLIALAWHKVLTGPEASSAILAVLAGNLYPKPPPPPPT